MYSLRQHRKGTELIGVGALLLVIGLASFIAELYVAIAAILGFLGLILFQEGLARFQVVKMPDSNGTRECMLEMISSAKESIEITTGTLSASAYLDWNRGAIFKRLSKKLSEGVQISIICGPNIDPRSREAYQELANHFENLDILVCKTNPIPHGLLIDKNRLRIEALHNEETDRNNVLFDGPGPEIAWFLNLSEQYRESCDSLLS